MLISIALAAGVLALLAICDTQVADAPEDQERPGSETADAQGVTVHETPFGHNGEPSLLEVG